MEGTHRNRDFSKEQKENMEIETVQYRNIENTLKQKEFHIGTERTHSKKESSAERNGENTQKQEEPSTATWRKQTEIGRFLQGTEKPPHRIRESSAQ